MGRVETEVCANTCDPTTPDATCSAGMPDAGAVIDAGVRVDGSTADGAPNAGDAAPAIDATSRSDVAAANDGTARRDGSDGGPGTGIDGSCACRSAGLEGETARRTHRWSAIWAAALALGAATLARRRVARRR
jgi:hypothetical protein